jgi:hypothetical protein
MVAGEIVIDGVEGSKDAGRLRTNRSEDPQAPGVRTSTSVRAGASKPRPEVPVRRLFVPSNKASGKIPVAHSHRDGEINPRGPQ